jgi:hypothetical protein
VEIAFPTTLSIKSQLSIKSKNNTLINGRIDVQLSGGLCAECIDEWFCERSSELVGFIETWTLQKPSVPTANLADEIAEEFGVPISRTAVNLIRSGL